MISKIITFGHKVRADFRIVPGRVLEVGSYDVNGSIRQVFQQGSQSYIGVDIQAGPGVDRVMDGARVAEEFGEAAFDTVLCCECLEHVVRPWEVVSALKRVLSPGGWLFVSTPTYGFPLHRYPIDCFRFGEDAYRLWLFDGLDIARLEELHDSMGWPVIAAVGRSVK